MNPDFPSLDKPPNKGSDFDLPYKAPAPDFIPLLAASLNLETELLSQYNEARRLIHIATYDDEVPVNQKAQAVNTATTVLAALIKSQADLYSLERVKKIEATLLDVLKEFPDMQEPFMKAYEIALNAE